jgi:hypothetical protein
MDIVLIFLKKEKYLVSSNRAVHQTRRTITSYPYIVVWPFINQSVGLLSFGGICMHKSPSD